MKRYNALVLLFVMLALASSSDLAVAQSGGGGLTWLDKLSGPGEFFGAAFYVRFCVANGERAIDFKKCRDDTSVWLNVGGGYLRTGADTREDLEYRAISIWTFEPSIDWRLPFDIEDTLFFEWGIGTGLHRFRSDGFPDFWRVSLQPLRLGFVVKLPDPWEVTARLTGTYFVDGFTAADFGDPDGTFVSRGELVPAAFILFSYSFY